MPIVTLPVEEHIYSLLSTDEMLQALLVGGVPVFNGEVPQGYKDPYVVITLHDTNDANANDGENIFSMNMYQVVTIIKNMGFLAVQSIADRVDYLMRKTPSTEINSIYIGHFMRERIVQMQIRDADDTWYHIGGIYRGMAHPLPFNGNVNAIETIVSSDVLNAL